MVGGNLFKSLHSVRRALINFQSEFSANGYRYHSTRPNPAHLETLDEMEAFEAALPRFVDKATQYSRQFDKGLASAWIERLLNYQLNEKSPGRGSMPYFTFKSYANSSELTEENLELARMVGWSNKLAEATFELSDDIVDASDRRHNAPCWHTLPDVGIQAATDIALMSNLLPGVLRTIVGHKNYYYKLLSTFSETLYCQYLGQTLDVLHSRDNIIHHSVEKFVQINTLKAGSFGTYAPIALGLDMTGCKDPKVYAYAWKALRPLGLIYQMRNDYLDCFRSSEVISHTDAQENKLTWLSATFMALANEDQQRRMQECYGKRDKCLVAKVKSLYEEVDMQIEFQKEERKTFDQVTQIIENCPFEKLKPVLGLFRDRLFKEYTRD